MMKTYLTTKKSVVIAMSALALTLGACGPKAPEARKQASQMDTAEFHQSQGDRALLAHRFSDAKAAYNKALQLAPDDAKASSGLAVALAYLSLGSNVTDPTRVQLFKQGESLLEKAIDQADDKMTTARAHSFAVRFHVIMQRPTDDWFAKAQNHYEEAIEATPGNAEPYFFMAAAHSLRLEYDQATNLYSKVLSFNADYYSEANDELKRIQKVQRALPGSRFGKNLANTIAITRADTAALLIAELRLDRLYVTSSRTAKSSFQVPASQRKFQTQVAPAQNMPDATDLRNHPMADTINMVIKLGIKGLEADASHKFHPSEKLTRAEFAMILQDVLVKITGDTSLATKFMDQNSPHPDVSTDRWYYNAVRTVVNRGMMEIKNQASGNFNPMGNVSGADALLAVSTLKNINR